MLTLTAAIVSHEFLIKMKEVEFSSMEQVAEKFVREDVHSMLVEDAHWKYHERKTDPFCYNPEYI